MRPCYHENSFGFILSRKHQALNPSEYLFFSLENARQIDIEMAVTINNCILLVIVSWVGFLMLKINEIEHADL